jgi:large subunit ribosomal protein L10
MARADKESTVAELTERFRSSSGVVLTEYRGLTVSQLGELRKTLDGHAQFAVVKNTLTKIAASEAGVTTQLADLLEGPSAIAFVGGDVVEAAKGLRDFSRNYPLLVIKGGVLDGKPLTPAEIVRLADLEPREVLLAKLAGAMKASLAGAAATFNALPSQLARLLAALEEKKRPDGGAVGADAPAATAEAPAEALAETGEAAAETATAETAVTAEAPAVGTEDS